MIYIGIDPGKKGAWAALDPKTMSVIDWLAADCPKNGYVNRRAKGHHAYYNHRMVGSLLELRRRAEEESNPITVIIEQQRTHPKEGRVSAFTTGYGFGLWTGILSAMKLPWRTVTGTVWTKEVLKGATTGGVFVHNQSKAKVKAKKSLNFVAQMFPDFASHPDGLTLNRRVNAVIWPHAVSWSRYAFVLTFRLPLA